MALAADTDAGSWKAATTYHSHQYVDRRYSSVETCDIHTTEILDNVADQILNVFFVRLVADIGAALDALGLNFALELR